MYSVIYIDAEVGKESRESNDWKLIVICAVSKLENVCTNIHSGNITITELRSIIAKQTQMNKLCEVTNKSQLAELQNSMEKRLKEFKHFEAYKMKLEHLLSHIGKVLIGKSMHDHAVLILFICNSCTNACPLICCIVWEPVKTSENDIGSKVWENSCKIYFKLIACSIAKL